LLNEFEHKKFADVVLMEFEKAAESLSSFASTSIEGNPLPLTEVKRVLKAKPKSIRDSEREVLNYNKALQELNRFLKKNKLTFSLDLILKIHHQVMAGLLDKFRCGKFRKEPVFVRDPRTGKDIFFPPDHGDVPKLMRELVSYIKKQQGKIDPLLLAGIFHKQFVLIHPFVDGNGRVARLATKAILADMGIDTFYLFSFENYYNRSVTQYFQMVGEKGDYYDIEGEVDFTEWLEYFTDGIIDELLRVQKEIEKISRTPDQALKEYHKVILTHIEKHGFITDADYAKLTNRAKATRSLDFKKLIELELIQREGKGKGTYYKLKKS